VRAALQRWFRRLPALAALVLTGAPVAARAQSPAPIDEVLPVTSTGPLAVDAGLVFALPARLPTGLSSGLGAGVTWGRRLAWGVRGSWWSASESSLVWEVSHHDFRLRGVVVLQQPAGRGVFGLRLGLGPTLVYEHRTRAQGARAGLSGADLESSALAAFPGGELEAVVSLHIAGRWLLVLSGGPTGLVADGGLQLGWTTQIGAGWQP